MGLQVRAFKIVANGHQHTKTTTENEKVYILNNE